ncbi:MAG: bifunctional diaminohydroxyphosphoribosylaminopyrimidine deaminase/5-amino-6-(5-phosphoribosylamino)uracil reductase RibD, partial [Sphingomonadaceae bacterium]
ARRPAGAGAGGPSAYPPPARGAQPPARGPACADLLAGAGVARVVAGCEDPDPRTAGRGLARLRAAGIEVQAGPGEDEASASLAGYLMRMAEGRPYVTLKLAMSLDGRIATAEGESRWITGDAARRHGHLLRARSDMILVGRGTYEADDPKLDVRIEGLEDRSPRRALLSRSGAPDGWEHVPAPEAIAGLEGVNDLLVEGGAGAAAAFLAADLVDRLFLYRAPVILGAGRDAVGDIGLRRLAEAHGRWRPAESRMLGPDRLEIYARLR